MKLACFLASGWSKLMWLARAPLQARLPEINELEKQIKASHEELTDRQFAAEAAATAAAAAAAAALEAAQAKGAAALTAARAEAQAAGLAAASREQVLHLFSTCNRMTSTKRPRHICHACLTYLIKLTKAQSIGTKVSVAALACNMQVDFISCPV